MKNFNFPNIIPLSNLETKSSILHFFEQISQSLSNKLNFLLEIFPNDFLDLDFTFFSKLDISSEEIDYFIYFLIHISQSDPQNTFKDIIDYFPLNNIINSFSNINNLNKKESFLFKVNFDFESIRDKFCLNFFIISLFCNFIIKFLQEFNEFGNKEYSSIIFKLILPFFTFDNDDYTIFLRKMTLNYWKKIIYLLSITN